MDDAFVNKALESLLRSAKWGPALRDLFGWVSVTAPDDDEVELSAVATALAEATEHLRERSLGWLELFRRLEGASYGDLILGRHGKKTRFQWREPPSALANAAMKLVASVRQPGGMQPVRPDAGSVQEIAFPFALRRDWTVYVRIPSNVTRDELHRLAEFTKLLPGE